MFLAGVPNIAEGLNTRPNSIVYSISTFLLGNTVGQLSDRYGRRVIIIITILLFTIAALASGSIVYFIFWRFVQGIAISGGRILATTVARDLFKREFLGKMMVG